MPGLLLGVVLDDLGRELGRLLAGAALVLGLALVLAVSVPLALVGVGTPTGSLGPAWTLGDLPRVDGVTFDEVPRDQLRVMEQVAAGSSCGLGWPVLAGVARVESGFGRQADQFSSAGAYGYGQFMEATWRAYGGGIAWRTPDPAEQTRAVDQRADSTNYHYALPAMERYLCALARETSAGRGPSDDLRRALFFYSHTRTTPFDQSDAYVTRVLALAAAYDRGAKLGATSLGSAPVEVAQRYLGVPYRFGATSPTTGLDCSALVQLVFRQLGVTLPRTAQLQYEATARVPDGQLQVGDLVFFARTYPDPHDWVTHVGIYIGGGQMINAPTEGDVVRVMPAFAGFWGAHYAGAGRVVGSPVGQAQPAQLAMGGAVGV
jgi:cell wall-associated NlpC family hydrolase